MLRHEDNLPVSPQSQPAAQVRVTPEELAAAVTALQIRKEGQPGTIAIGDAVGELGLDVTPEEVLEEVQLRRAASKRPSFGTRLKVLSAALAALVSLSVWGITQQPTDNASVAVQTISTTSFMPMRGPTPQRIKVDPNLVVGDASGKILMLSEVGDSQPVRCTFYSQTGGFGQYTAENAQVLWILVKHDGKVYVRGHTQKISPKVLSVLGADVISVDNDPQFSVPITLPLNGFVVTPGAGSNIEFHANNIYLDKIEFHANNIHLDKHAYEKW